MTQRFGHVVMEPSESTAQRHRVLLVEDQPSLVEWVRQALAQEQDLELLVCMDAASAVDKAHRVRPSVILQDLVMPNKGGFELLSDYRAEADLSDIPVVVLSALDNVSEKVRAFSLGAADYLVKLPNRVEFVARVRAHALAHATRRELRETKEELRLIADHFDVRLQPHARARLAGGGP